MLSIKSEINGITAKNSVWLQNVLVPHKEHSSPFQGKCRLTNKLSTFSAKSQCIEYVFESFGLLATIGGCFIVNYIIWLFSSS